MKKANVLNNLFKKLHDSELVHFYTISVYSS